MPGGLPRGQMEDGPQADVAAAGVGLITLPPIGRRREWRVGIAAAADHLAGAIGGASGVSFAG